MAVSPPGDIVLDVLRAADPASVQEARQALSSGAPPAIETAKATQNFDRAYGAAMRVDARTAQQAGGDTRLYDSYREFEAMVLQQFMKSMLPEDTAQFFGEGTAGEIWKSMMAEQLGRALAEGGGIGIADRLMENKGLGEATGPDMGGPSMARIMLQELERTTVERWGEDEETDDPAPLWTAG